MIERFLYIGLGFFLVFFIPFLRRMYFSENKKEVVESEMIRQDQRGKKRYDFFDFLRGLAILAVIIIHIGDNFLVEQTGNLLFIKIINNITRFAVPFFLISSGVLLYRGLSLKSFYFKKFIRIFLPFFLVTTAVGIYYQVGFKDLLLGYISGAASLPYYFMSILLQFYLIYPFLERYSKKKYFLHITFLITIASFFIEDTWIVYGIPLFPRYLFFFTYGISQKDRFLSENFRLELREKVFWASLIIYYLFSTVYFQIYFYNVRLFFALALFNLFFLYKELFKRLPGYSFFCYLGKNSLWIYLIHFFIVQAIYPFTKYWSDNFYIQYLYFFVLSIPLSIIISLMFGRVYNLYYNYFKRI
jgi:peptidoglycan/LPS O-acetylase OafA/YrhL